MADASDAENEMEFPFAILFDLGADDFGEGVAVVEEVNEVADELPEVENEVDIEVENEVDIEVDIEVVNEGDEMEDEVVHEMEDDVEDEVQDDVEDEVQDDVEDEVAVAEGDQQEQVMDLAYLLDIINMPAYEGIEGPQSPIVFERPLRLFSIRVPPGHSVWTTITDRARLGTTGHVSILGARGALASIEIRYPRTHFAHTHEGVFQILAANGHYLATPDGILSADFRILLLGIDGHLLGGDLVLDWDLAGHIIADDEVEVFMATTAN